MASSTWSAEVVSGGVSRSAVGVIGFTSSPASEALAATSLLISPSSDQLSTYQQDLDSGKLAAVPPVPPRILFVWGPGRVLPVAITSLTVTEEIFDGLLVPIRASVKAKLEELARA